MPDSKSINPFKRAADVLTPPTPAPSTPTAPKAPKATKYTGPEYEVLPDEHWVDMNKETSRIADRINRKGQELTQKRLLKQSPKTNGSKK